MPTKNAVPRWVDDRLQHLSPQVLYDESRRQVEKWGIQRRTPFEWMCYLTEEVGELAEAISEMVYRGGRPEAVEREGIHAATVALKIAEMSMQGGE